MQYFAKYLKVEKQKDVFPYNEKYILVTRVCTCDKLKKFQTCSIYVHVYKIKYDHIKECGALMKNSVQSKQRFLFSNKKNYVHYKY